MIDFVGDIEQQYESYCNIAEEYGFLDTNAAKSGFRCTVKKPEFNAGWIGFTGGVAFCRDEIYKVNSKLNDLRADNVELKRKYQYAVTQLSDVDGHYAVLKKELNDLKAQLAEVHESGIESGEWVLVPTAKLQYIVDEIELAFKEDSLLALGDLLPIQQDIKAMIEAAREQN